MESNPYNLKTLDEKPSNYLDGDEFFNLLKKKRFLWLIKIICPGLLMETTYKCAS